MPYAYESGINQHRKHYSETYEKYSRMKALEEKYPNLLYDDEFQADLQSTKEDLEGHGATKYAEKYKTQDDTLPNRVTKKIRER